MSAEEELGEAAKDYRAFLARGGQRGSAADRKRRQRMSDLIVQIKEEKARAERVTEEDEVAHYADLNVFGE